MEKVFEFMRPRQGQCYRKFVRHYKFQSLEKGLNFCLDKKANVIIKMLGVLELSKVLPQIIVPISPVLS